jgi:hypothetical protein
MTMPNEHNEERDEPFDPTLEELGPIRDQNEVLVEAILAATQPQAAHGEPTFPHPQPPAFLDYDVPYLVWKSLKAYGHIQMDANNKNEFLDFELFNPWPYSPGFLIFAVRKVDEWNSFITLNAYLSDSSNVGFNSAKNQPYFVTSIFRNTSDDYEWQIHRIMAGRLKAYNHLGIHARNKIGLANGDIDAFKIARIFLIYVQKMKGWGL